MILLLGARPAWRSSAQSGAIQRPGRRRGRLGARPRAGPRAGSSQPAAEPRRPGRARPAPASARPPSRRLASRPRAARARTRGRRPSTRPRPPARPSAAVEPVAAAVDGAGVGRRRSATDGAFSASRILRQVAEHLGRRLVAVGRVLGHQLHDQPVEVGREVGPVDRQADRRVLDVLQRQRQRRLGPERRLAGEHVVERHAQRVEVAAVVERVPLRLLGAHVERACPSSRRAGSGRARSASWSRQRPKSATLTWPLRVSSRFSGLMSRWIRPELARRADGHAGLLHDRERQRQVERPLLLEVVAQVRPLDVLHRDERMSSTQPSV